MCQERPSCCRSGLLLAGALAAAIVTGLTGFAFAIVAAGAWVHFLPPTQATSLTVAYGVIVQGVSVWKLRRAIVWWRLMPFLLGGALACRSASCYCAGPRPPPCLRLSRLARGPLCPR